MIVVRLFNRLIAALALGATGIGFVLCGLAAGLGTTDGRWDDIVTATELGLVVSLIALGASWLFERRHPARWAGWRHQTDAKADHRPLAQSGRNIRLG